jgi:hypothetical protein
MSWFNKKKKISEKFDPTTPFKAQVKPLNYPPKIVLAWAKTIEGNKEITKWLQTNGYPELVYASSAIHLKNNARDWLMVNGYPHLMAMIHAAEGDEKAQSWLKKHKFELLYHIAMAVEHETNSLLWLKKNTTPDILILTQAIKKVKDKIEENHNDIHTFGDD